MDVNGFAVQKENAPSSQELADATDISTIVLLTRSVHTGMFESNFPVDKLSCSYKILEYV